MPTMDVHLVSAEEAKFTADVNAILEQFLSDLSKLPDFGKGQNRGNVDRKNLIIGFVDNINTLRK